MKTPSETDWDEFKDIDFSNWKRIRSAIEHENQLINQRITWFYVVNGSLLVAFNEVYKNAQEALTHIVNDDRQVMLFVLTICGGFFSMVSAAGIRAARNQHDYLVKWWEENAKRDDHPKITGKHPEGPIKLHYDQFPYIFVLLWAVLLALGIYEMASPDHGAILPRLGHAIPAVLALLGIVLVFILGRTWERNRK